MGRRSTWTSSATTSGPRWSTALTLTLDDYLEVRQRRFAYAADLDRLLGDDTVLVTPTNGYAGWLPNGMLPNGDRPAEAEGYNTGEFNMSGHPALSVPAGLSANGSPFGLQVAGPRYRDDLVLEFGAAWEGDPAVAADRARLRAVPAPVGDRRHAARSRRSNAHHA